MRRTLAPLRLVRFTHRLLGQFKIGKDAGFYVSIGKDAEFCDIDSRLERSVGAVVAFFHRTNFLVAEFNKGDHHERIRVVEQIATEYF
jgi:hypothetical protein